MTCPRQCLFFNRHNFFLATRHEVSCSQPRGPHYTAFIGLSVSLPSLIILFPQSIIPIHYPSLLLVLSTSGRIFLTLAPFSNLPKIGIPTLSITLSFELCLLPLSLLRYPNPDSLLSVSIQPFPSLLPIAFPSLLSPLSQPLPWHSTFIKDTSLFCPYCVPTFLVQPLPTTVQIS